MLWITVCLLTTIAQAAEAPSGPHSVVVQVVDEVWVPLPGLKVEILRPRVKEPLDSKRTDQRGQVGFSIEPGTYTVRVPAESGFAETSVTARFVPPSESQPTAYVQLRLTRFAKKPVLTHPR